MGAGFHGGFGATKGYFEGNPAAGESYLLVQIMITSIILQTVKMLILMVCMMWLGMVHLIKLSLEMAIMITTHQESWPES